MTCCADIFIETLVWMNRLNGNICYTLLGYPDMMINMKNMIKKSLPLFISFFFLYSGVVWANFCGQNDCNYQKNQFQERSPDKTQISGVCDHCKNKNICGPNKELGIPVIMAEKGHSLMGLPNLWSEIKNLDGFIMTKSYIPTCYLRGPPCYQKILLYLKNRQLLI